MLIKLIFLFLLLGIVMFLVLWYYVQLFVLLFRRRNEAVYVPSFNRDIALMKGSLPLIAGKKLIDLGCGDGKALRFFIREYGLKCQGYDFNSFAISYGKVINRIKGYKMKLYCKDFFSAPIDEADYLYLYLFPEQLVSIEDWLFAGVKKGTIIISNTFRFQQNKPFEVIKDRRGKERIFLYRK